MHWNPSLSASGAGAGNVPTTATLPPVSAAVPTVRQLVSSYCCCCLDL